MPELPNFGKYHASYLGRKANVHHFHPLILFQNGSKADSGHHVGDRMLREDIHGKDE